MINVDTGNFIKGLLPRDKSYKVKVERNLSLIVYPSGRKSFRMRAFKNNKETTITLGNYPDLSLDDAIERYKKFCKPDLLETYFKQADSANFRSYALKYMEQKVVSAAYSEDRLARFQNHIFPHLGRLKMHEISNKLVKTILLDIQATGKIVLGQRCLTLIKQVFDFANTEDSGSRLNFEAIRKMLKNSQPKNFAAATTVTSLKTVMASLRKMNATEVIKLNIECGMHWFMRPSELVSLKWSDVDFEEQFINFKPCKNGAPNVVPLNKHTLGLLSRLRMLSDGSEYVFPSPVNVGRHVDANTACAALRNIGAEHTMHGFRATARTLIVEELKLEEKHVEKQLSHKTKNPNGTAYDRTKFLKKRIKMMKKWSAYLVKLESEI